MPRSRGNWTTRRPPDDRKETQTAVVRSCFPFIRYGQNHLARHSERGKKTRQTEEEVGRQHQETDGPGVRLVPEGSREQEKMEKTGCKIICGATTTLAVKGLMMMMMMMMCVCLRACVSVFTRRACERSDSPRKTSLWKQFDCCTDLAPLQYRQCHQQSPQPLPVFPSSRNFLTEM